MEKLAESLRSNRQNSEKTNHTKKNKKKGHRRHIASSSSSSSFTNCAVDDITNEANEVPEMEYPDMFWQQPNFQPAPHHLPPHHNGQRLFTAMSDPSVCGYSAVPVTYTMEPVSLPPMYRLYQPVPRPSYRTLRGRPRRNVVQNRQSGNRHFQNNSNNLVNGYSSLQEHDLNSSESGSYQNGDYMSLPPTANIENRIGGDELNSEHRRYSDPGLGPADLPVHPQSEDSDSAESGSSITTIGKNNKLVLSIIEQMNTLKDSNSQLFKELQETKVELENVKSELGRYRHAMPDYQPGMLSDIIRGIRDASKTREECLISRVTSLVADKQSQQSKELEQIRLQVTKLLDEKAEYEKRISSLEEEVSSLKLNANSGGHEIAAFEEEALALRRELQEARASRTTAETHATKCINGADFQIRRSVVTPVYFNTPCNTSTPVRTAWSCITTPSVIPPNRQQKYGNNSSAGDDHQKPTSTPLTTPLTTGSSSVNKTRLTLTFPKENTTPNERTTKSSVDFNTVPLPSICQETSSSSSSSSSSSVSASASSSSSSSSSSYSSSSFSGHQSQQNPTISDFFDNLQSMNPARNSQPNNVLEIIQIPCRSNAESLEGVISVKRVDEIGGNYRDSLEILPLDSENTDLSDTQIENEINEMGEKAAFQETVRKIDKGSFKRRSRHRKGQAKASLDDTERLLKVVNGSEAKSATSCSSKSMEKDEQNGDEGFPRSEDTRNGAQVLDERALTEIPDVMVISGSSTSLVPRDLCSTRILTSRVLTAPSRATYTTAYI